ncbi:hypothetical protein PAPHI01_2488 [Pancytospora philotis]|nr:hypothetical protein PAPHI01_2488 [Pancytospora philotis]
MAANILIMRQKTPYKQKFKKRIQKNLTVRLDYGEETELLSQIMAQAELKCDKCKLEARLEVFKGRHTIWCTNKFCGHRRSLWKGTIFEELRIPREQALGILDLWMDGASTKLICKLARIERKAVHRLL